MIFHFIGIILFAAPQTFGLNKGTDLTWMNLTLCGLLVFFSEDNLKKALFYLLVIGGGGFLIEWIGTATGLLFGNYSYGGTLGFKLLDVPLLIGVNWFVIVLASANIVRDLKGGIIGKAILTAILCTIMDFVMEPVAIKFDFWSWGGEAIPFSNYLTWFIFSGIFGYIYLKNSRLKNRTASWLFLIWFVFFAVLNMI